MPFWTTQKKGPQSQLKCPKSPFVGFKIPQNGLLDILIDFWGPFSGGSKMAFFGLSKALWGFRGSVGGPGDCNPTRKWEQNEEKLKAKENKEN